MIIETWTWYKRHNLILMKKCTVFSGLFLLCLAVRLPASDSFSSKVLFIGFRPEVNAHTREVVAAGGGFLFGFDLNQYFATGLRIGFFHNMDTVATLEPQAFFRYYIPWKQWPPDLGGFFVQAEAGYVAYFEYGETFHAFSGGLSAGWRSVITKNWVMEPAVRFGYPYIWGVGITAGYRFL